MCDLEKLEFVQEVIEITVSTGAIFKRRQKRCLAKVMDRLIVIWTPTEVKAKGKKGGSGAKTLLEINFIADVKHLSLSVKSDKLVELTETVPGFLYNSKNKLEVSIERMQDLVKL